jgi:peptide chain release factor subunit 1
MTSTRSLTKFSRAFNRQSVQGAIRALQTALKRYKTIPPNGIALFAGMQPISTGSTSSEPIATASISSASSSASMNERERLMVREIEPIKPLRTGMYHCDGKFHVDPLLAQLSDDITYGFVVLDGAGCHMYSVAGDSYTLVWKHGDPALPKKHGRGGQSAPRFGRLRDLARALWISIVAKQLNIAFTDKSTGNVNVAGIVLCGSGELKQQLSLRSNVLADRVSSAILPTLIDLQYGGHSGIQEAIRKAAPLINEHSFTRQRGVLVSFMDGIANDTGLISYGPQDTMHALQAGAVSTLLLSESLSFRRVLYRNLETQETCYDYVDEAVPIPHLPSHVRTQQRSAEEEEMVHHSSSSSSAPSSSPYGDLSIHPNSTVTGGESGTEWRVESFEPLLDFLVGSVAKYGATVQLISPSSTQGHQFDSAFGGIGAMLRWTIPLPSSEMPMDGDEDSDGGYDFDF